LNGITACATGRIGSDGELKHSSGGNPYVTFNLALDVAKKADGDPTEWLRVAVFGEQAEALTGKLSKGGRVYVEGRLRLETWTTRENEQRSTLKLAAWVCQPMGIENRRPRQDGQTRNVPGDRPRRPNAMPEAMAVGAGRNTRQQLGLDDGDLADVPF
jgi:single-strand DNA-binding protein